MGKEGAAGEGWGGGGCGGVGVGFGGWWSWGEGWGDVPGGSVVLGGHDEFHAGIAAWGV